MESLLQLIGAVLVLAAFVAAQAGVWRTDGVPYLVLNVAGSVVLAFLALHGRDWGFLLLEGVWGLVSAWSLARALAPRRPRALSHAG